MSDISSHLFMPDSVRKQQQERAAQSYRWSLAAQFFTLLAVLFGYWIAIDIHDHDALSAAVSSFLLFASLAMSINSLYWSWRNAQSPLD